MPNYGKQMLFPKIHPVLYTDFPEKSSRKFSGKQKPDYDPDTLFNLPPRETWSNISYITLSLHS